MQFHLQFHPKVCQQKITHQEDLLFIGSCFSEHIGNKLLELKFKTHINPFGIVFNPKSIYIILSNILEKQLFTEQDVFENNQLYFSFDAHSSLSKTSKRELLDSLNKILMEWYSHLKNAKWLCITFGSAYSYRYKQNNKIVSNCHRLLSDLFTKELLQANDLIEEYNVLLQKLKMFNPNLNVLLSVSPVKHLKDGIIENNLSKAILIQTVHHIVNENSSCFYFPAYELINDDLRDYRFYKSDMAHPNEQAIEYVFQKFSEVYFAETTTKLNSEIIDILQAKKHLPINPSSIEFIDFKKKYLLKSKKIQTENPFLDLKSELDYFS